MEAFNTVLGAFWGVSGNFSTLHGSGAFHGDFNVVSGEFKEISGEIQGFQGILVYLRDVLKCFEGFQMGL